MAAARSLSRDDIFCIIPWIASRLQISGQEPKALVMYALLHCRRGGGGMPTAGEHLCYHVPWWTFTNPFVEPGDDTRRCCKCGDTSRRGVSKC